jgi:hypothetical protein
MWVPEGFDGDVDTVPYSVGPAYGSPRLARLEEGRFHIWESGVLGHLLDTASAILISRELASVLATEVKDGWRFREVTILDLPDREIPGYVELLVDAEMTPSSLSFSGGFSWFAG